MAEKPLAWIKGKDGKFRCSHCDKISVLMQLPDWTKEHAIDSCIAPIVLALNNGDVTTMASCCGHGDGMGNIWLDDGRVLGIFPDWDTYKAIWDLAIKHGLIKPRQY